jgi:hypothetical protein
MLRHRGIEPLLKKLLDERPAIGGGQPPGGFPRAYRESGSTQGIDNQSGGIWTGPAGTLLMIIEGNAKRLIVRVHWV